jgi:predicted O-methyltransferase YrrM
VIKDKLRPGGLLITDNMLFHGTIFDPENHTKSVEGIREFTKLVMNDPTLTASIVPIRDGLLVAQRATR